MKGEEGVKTKSKANTKAFRGRKKQRKRKGAWGMPWLSEAKKDVTSCEKPR